MLGMYSSAFLRLTLVACGIDPDKVYHTCRTPSEDDALIYDVLKGAREIWKPWEEAGCPPASEVPPDGGGPVSL